MAQFFPDNFELAKNEPQLVFTRGIPASGKSTWAKQITVNNPGVVRVNRDDIRTDMFGKEYHQSPPVPELEAQVTVVEHERIRTGLMAGRSVIVDGTNLRREYANKIIQIGREVGVQKIDHVDFQITPAEALRRNKSRERVVPDAAMQFMISKLGPNGELQHWRGDYADKVKPIKYPTTRRMAVSFDADGTLWNTAPIVHHVKGGSKDWESFHNLSEFCQPNQEVVDALLRAYEEGYAILITTARAEKYREVTQKWLDRLGLPFENMFMRANNDARPDYEVKKDMYANHIKPYYDLVRAFDDNEQAVRNWKENNIAVTIVPGFDAPVVASWDHNPHYSIEDPFKLGRCLRCNRKLKSGGTIGPECAKY